jgi:hypothetical protein
MVENINDLLKLDNKKCIYMMSEVRCEKANNIYSYLCDEHCEYHSKKLGLCCAIIDKTKFCRYKCAKNKKHCGLHNKFNIEEQMLANKKKICSLFTDGCTNEIMDEINIKIEENEIKQDINIPTKMNYQYNNLKDYIKNINELLKIELNNKKIKYDTIEIIENNEIVYPLKVNIKIIENDNIKIDIKIDTYETCKICREKDIKRRFFRKNKKNNINTETEKTCSKCNKVKTKINNEFNNIDKGLYHLTQCSSCRERQKIYDESRKKNNFY